MALLTPKKPRNSTHKATSEAGGTDEPVIKPAPKSRRRPLLLVLAAVMLLAGALGATFAIQSISTAQDVVAARTTIERGQTITRDNLMVVKIGVDPALHPVPAASIDSLVGQQAAYDIVAGGMVLATQVTNQPIPQRGSSIVGLNVTAANAPVAQLRPAATVRLIYTPGEQGQLPTKGSPVSIAATVVSLTTDPATGATQLSLQVASGDGPRAAALISTGRAAVVLDPQE